MRSADKSRLKEAVDAFLAKKRIAVVGVSRHSTEAANAIYRKLESCGYEVFPVNPAAETVEGARCYPDLASIEGGVEAAVVATPPEVSAKVVEDCAALGIGHVWLHRSFGQGSVSREAIESGQAAGVSLIPGACPMMFCQPVDVAHRCMRWFLGSTGRLTEPLSAPAATRS